MRQLTVNAKGQQSMSICLFCRVNEVFIDDWNKRCVSCKEVLRAEQAKELAQIEVGLVKRVPAAVIEVDGTQKVLVDKFGKELENPGYDFQNDPRGWGFTKAASKPRTIVL